MKSQPITQNRMPGIFIIVHWLTVSSTSHICNEGIFQSGVKTTYGRRLIFDRISGNLILDGPNINQMDSHLRLSSLRTFQYALHLFWAAQEVTKIGMNVFALHCAVSQLGNAWLNSDYRPQSRGDNTFGSVRLSVHPSAPPRIPLWQVKCFKLYSAQTQTNWWTYGRYKMYVIFLLYGQ